MNYSDSFYFTDPADYADYNYFTDFVKIKIWRIFPLLAIRVEQPGTIGSDCNFKDPEYTHHLEHIAVRKKG